MTNALAPLNPKFYTPKYNNLLSQGNALSPNNLAPIRSGNALNTIPNYLLNSYPNNYTPGLLSPVVKPPVVTDPWGNDPSPNGPADAPSEPYSGQGSLTAQDIGQSMQNAGKVMSLLGVPVAPLFSLAGKSLSTFGGGAPSVPSAGAISMSGDAGIGGGLGIQGAGAAGAAATQSRNDPQPAPTGIAADGQGDGTGDTGGPKIICNELYRQGFMPGHIWKADERFGATLDKAARDGYHAWARPWVRVMQRSPLATRLTWLAARPWAYHMAFKMKAVEEDNPTGRLLMKIGLPLCRAIGKVSRARMSLYSRLPWTAF